MNIHLIMQSKGGVGKSFIASVLTQYLITFSKVAGFDVDPSNSSFADNSMLPVTPIDIIDSETKDIQQSKFDELIEKLLEKEAQDIDNIVIDSGSSNFIALNNYLVDCDVIHSLKELGHHIFIHTVIAGGDNLVDTISSLHKLCNIYADLNTDMIIWLNQHFGKIENEGKTFQDFKVYAEHKDKFKAIITLPAFRLAFLEDLNLLLTRKQTFQYCINASQYRMMQKQRFKIMQRTIFDEIKSKLEELL